MQFHIMKTDWIPPSTQTCSPSPSLCLIHKKYCFNTWRLNWKNVTLPYDIQAYATVSVHLLAQAHTQTYLHWPGFSLFHADMLSHTHTHTHTHTLCQSHEAGMLRCRQIYKPLSHFLPLMELRFSYIDTLYLLWESEMLYDLLNGQWEARREERGDERMGWSNLSATIIVCRHSGRQLCAGSSMQSIVPASYLGQIQKSFSLTTISVYISQTLHENSLLLWSHALTFLRLFNLALPCFQVLCYLSISFTH